ncbi:MAG: nuclear transport factor 2 family protein [Myxococcota bacterium]
MHNALIAAVRQVNGGFYRAFRERDSRAMARLWAKEHPVACIHPGMAPIFGRDAVLDSWRGILAHPGAPQLECSAERVHVFGTSALVTCLEGAPDALPRLVATNAFVIEGGLWRLTHHHGAALLGPISDERSNSSGDEAAN